MKKNKSVYIYPQYLKFEKSDDIFPKFRLFFEIKKIMNQNVFQIQHQKCHILQFWLVEECGAVLWLVDRCENFTKVHTFLKVKSRNMFSLHFFKRQNTSVFTWTLHVLQIQQLRKFHYELDICFFLLIAIHCTRKHTY